MSWSNERIPISVAPLPGEGLDSWLVAYARRLRTSEVGLLAFFGLPKTQFEFMVRATTNGERQAISRRTGVDPEDLRAMTLERWNGLVVTFDPQTRLFATTPPSMLHSGRYSRFCPVCLREAPGRWQLSWRLPWTFACTRHNRLLLDGCHTCGASQRINKRVDIPESGLCIGAKGATGCGFPLSQSPSVALPPAGHVMRAQEKVNVTLLGSSRASTSTRQRAREIMVIAQRVLRSLPTHVDEAPALVHEVLEECGNSLPSKNRRREGSDAHNTAVGSAIASAVLDSTLPEHEAIFPWLLKANTSSRAKDSYPITWAHAWYQAVGPDLATRALATVDEKVSWPTRIRYGTTTSAPAWPTASDTDIEHRATKVPAMLWPAWTMRVMHGPPAGHRLAAFRRGTASLLLLPGSNWTFVRASRHLGNNLTKPNWTILTDIVNEDDCDILTSTLVLLARALEAHQTPVDYQRRRALFSEGEIIVDSASFRAYCRRQGRLHNERLYKYIAWLVRHLLLGAEPGTSSRSYAEHMKNALLLHSELREFAHQQAEANLRLHGIDEPLQWEPPSDWLPNLRWPGIDREEINREDLATQMSKRRPLAQVTEAVNVSEDHIRLYLETTALDAPAVSPSPPPKGQRGPLPKQGILTTENLRRLYIAEGMSTPKIAALADCSPSTIGLLLKEGGIPVRRREGPLQAADGTVVTAEWLEREYVQLGRTTTELGEELHCHNAFVSHLLKRYGIPTRPLFAVSSPFVRLGVKLSPTMQSVIRLRCHTQGLRNIIRLPGHHDIASACRALGIVGNTMRYQLGKVEEAVGFTIIERTNPLTVTSKGKSFLAEARRLLILLDRHTTS